MSTNRIDRVPSGTAFGNALTGSTITPNDDGTFDLTSPAGTVTVSIDDDGVMSMVDGTNPQELRIYNTDDGAGNAEWGGVSWDSDNLVIGTSQSGTGSTSDIEIQSGRTITLETPGGFDLYLAAHGFSNGLAISSSSIHPVAPASSSVGKAANPFSNIFLRPSASLTPAANGDLTIEATNDTTLTLKLKGSDGTVRSGTITLS